ncbi:MAG: hypothetical protein LCH61_17235 [Proteobacteria bacterium]|nr:hypothetical protein [Pseudomonadota bacterium]
MAMAKHITTSEVPKDPTRRSVLLSLPALGAVALASRATEAESGPAPLFLSPIAGHPGSFALCTPCNRVTHANSYLLNDGAVVRAESFHGMRVRVDGVWRSVPSDALNSRVIGWVVAIYSADATGAQISSIEEA